jgi:hypothetical protein
MTLSKTQGGGADQRRRIFSPVAEWEALNLETKSAGKAFIMRLSIPALIALTPLSETTLLWLPQPDAKKATPARHWWLSAVIPAIWEAEIRRITG